MLVISNIKSILKGYIELQEDTVYPLESMVRFLIGSSHLNKAIQCFQIGTGDQKILFIAGIHGNEVGTTKLAYKLIQWLYIHQSEFSNATFYVIPALNPDGYAQAVKNKDLLNGGRVGRFNSKNVDLNRNFDTPSFQKNSLWSFGKKYRNNVKVNCGETGNSEPETQAIIRFISENNIKCIFSFHNVGADVLSAKDVISTKVGDIYSKEAHLRVMNENEWLNLKQTGTFKEWCELKGIPFLEIETTKRWGSDWKRQLPAIKASIAYLHAMK